MDSTQQEPLWDDDEIIERYRVAFGKNPDVHHMALLCVMRDELLAQHATLRHERDDCRDLYRSLRTEANMLLEERDKAETERDQLRQELAERPDIDLPRLSKDDLITEIMRLRRLHKELTDELYRLESAPPTPEPQPGWLAKFPPEWDRHPWANWACLVVSHGGIDGVTLWWNYFEVKPEWGKKSYNWVDGQHGFANPVTRAPLSLVFDTKDTLMQRPAPGAND